MHVTCAQSTGCCSSWKGRTRRDNKGKQIFSHDSSLIPQLRVNSAGVREESEKLCLWLMFNKTILSLQAGVPKLGGLQAASQQDRQTVPNWSSNGANGINKPAMVNYKRNLQICYLLNTRHDYWANTHSFMNIYLCIIVNKTLLYHLIDG